MIINTGYIIFINNDLAGNTQSTLENQLRITESIDGYEFDQRVLEDPNYPAIIHASNLRLLVIRSYFELTNRNLADVVLFIKNGMAYVESNKFGPPGQSFNIDRIQLDKILVAQTQPPMPPTPPNNIQSNILYPLFDHNYTDLYPFGTDPICPPDNDGDTEDE